MNTNIKRASRALVIVSLVLCLTAGMGTAHAEENTSAFTAEETAYLNAHGPFKMCVDPDWYPYEAIDENGQHWGIASDLIGLISQRTGVQIELVPTKNWDESLACMETGKCDMLSFLNNTADRRQWMIFTNPYFTDPNVLITREEHDYIPDISRLSGETAVLPQGTSIEERMRADYPNIHILTVASETEAMEYVSSRRADFTVRSLTMAAYTIRKDGLFNLKINGQIPGYENRLSMGVSRNEPMLRNILNKGIATLTEEEIQQAINNHIPVQVTQGFDYRLFFIIFGCFTFVVVAGLLWIFQLRKFNKKLESQKKEMAFVQERLAESEAVYKSFLSASPDAVVITDTGGVILAASPAAYSLVGIRAEESLLTGRVIYDFVAPRTITGFGPT